jgi:hypothetical protein
MDKPKRPHWTLPPAQHEASLSTFFGPNLGVVPSGDWLRCEFLRAFPKGAVHLGVGR